MGFILEIAAGLLGFSGFVPLLVEAVKSWQSQAQAAEAIQRIEAKAEQEPEKVSYAWDAARRKLENYFDRNLSQVNAIFWVAVAAMGVGFTLIIWAVWRSFLNPLALPATYVAAGSGLVIEFIAATFMLIYRSTLKQANSYTAILERINAVGMAVQIAETIDEQDRTLRNETRAAVVTLLLQANRKDQVESQPRSRSSQRPRKRNLR